MRGIRHAYMDAATADGADVSGGGSALEQVADSAADTSATGQAAVTGQPSALEQAGVQAAEPARIPDKYHVKKEDGSLDVEASAAKLADAYSSLAKRLGTGDLPPKEAKEYQIKVPDLLKDDWNPAEDKSLQAFLGEAHKRGFTQQQIDLAMDTYFAIAPALVTSAKQLSAEECVTELKKDWTTDEQYKAEVGKAKNALLGYAGNDAKDLIKEYGNDPRFVRMMNRIGSEMGEDRSINPSGGIPQGTSVESLMQSEAYSNPKHADHAKVSKQVADYFAAQARKAEASGNTPIL